MFISASDTHLSETIYVGLPQMRGDSYRSFAQICDHAVATQATALVLAGDVFDGQPSPLDVECFLHNLGNLKRAKIKVYAIQGQHGHDEKLPWTSIDRYVIDLNNKVFEIEPGVFCAGFDTLPPNELQHELSKLDPKVNLLVLHQMARYVFGERDGEQAWNFDPQWVPNTVKLVLLGDYHNPIQLTRGARDKCPMLYHGSTCMQSIDEDPAKSFLEVKFERSMPLLDKPDAGQEKFIWKQILLQTRPFQSHTIMTADALSAASSCVEKAEPDSLVHIKYDPRVGTVESDLRKANDRCHFLFRLLPIKDVVDMPSIENLKDISLETCLAAAVDPATDPEFYSFVLVLLQSKKPKETLEALKAKYLEVKHEPVQAGPQAVVQANPVP